MRSLRRDECSRGYVAERVLSAISEESGDMSLLRIDEEVLGVRLASIGGRAD